MKEVCELFGVSRQAYYAARKRPEPTGPKPRPERRGPWVTRAKLEEAVLAKTSRHLAWGVRKIWASLRRDGVLSSRKRVWAVMRDLGLVLPPMSERVYPARRGHVAVPESNRRWAIDLTTTWTRRDGWVAIVPLVDSGDRSVLGLHVTKSQEAPDVLVPLERALSRQFGGAAGVPDGLELRSDNGPQFTGADCERLCKAWGVEQTFSPPGRPTGNAVAERLIQTIKVELVWTRDWESLEELEGALGAWREVYNRERPHQALAWRTPVEKRADNLGLASPAQVAA